MLPGIVSLRIKAALSISSPSSPFNATIDGLILTLVDHAVYGVLRVALASFPEYGWMQWLRELGYNVTRSPTLQGELGRQFLDAGGFLMVVVAGLVGFVAGVVRYHGWDFRVLRRLHLTNRTGENLVWAETFTKALPSYAVVACKDGSRFLGWIDTFSEEAGNHELFMRRAFQVQPDGSTLPIDGPGVLLTRENPIVRVELWSPV